MDRLGNIEAFVLAAELGSFTLAAKRMGLSPSALSRRVSQLEDELGVHLFHRTTRAVRASEDGLAFLERARAALRELDEARQAAYRSRGRPAGRLRVEAPTIIGRHVIVPELQSFLSRYGEVQLELVLRDVPGDLVSDGVDVALRLGPLEPSGLVAQRLGRTRMRLCAAPSYLRRKGTPRNVAALGRHERLGFSWHDRAIPWILRDGVEKREVQPSGRMVVNDGGALIDLTSRGAGISWLCDFMTERARRSGELVEVLEDSVWEETSVSIVSLPSRQILPKVRAFVEFVVAALAKSGVEMAGASRSPTNGP